MQSVNIRQLRDTRRLKTWLRAGKTGELRERDRVIARIVPEGQPTSTAKWPDFAARAKKVLCDQILPGADLVIQHRGRYRRPTRTPVSPSRSTLPLTPP